MVKPPVPNTGPAKFVWAGAGAAGGVGAALGIDRTQATPEAAAIARERDGVELTHSSQTKLYAMAGLFTLGTGIALGLSKQSGTSGLTTSVYIAGGALLSTVAGAGIAAASERTDDRMAIIGVSTALLAAGGMFGVRDEFSRLPIRNIGLALLSGGVGVTAPAAIEFVGKLPSSIGTSYDYRPGSELAETGPAKR